MYVTTKFSLDIISSTTVSPISSQSSIKIGIAIFNRFPLIDLGMLLPKKYGGAERKFLGAY